MNLWFKNVTPEEINLMCENTLVSHLDILFNHVDEQSLSASMPVKDSIKQPYGIVHGGANCVLAETLGSIAANLTCDPKTHHAVGLNINTNHVKAVRNGVVKGVVKPVHKGKKIQVWDIETFNNKDELTSKTSMTMAIIEKLKT